MNNAPLDAEQSSAPETSSKTAIPSTTMESSESPRPTCVEQENSSSAQEAIQDAVQPEDKTDTNTVNSSFQESEEDVAEERKDSFASRCFSGLSFAGPFVLFVLWIIQAIPNLLGRDPRALHELTAGLQTSYLGADPWLTEQLASHPSSDMTPVYNWFLKGLSQIPGIDSLLAAIPGTIPAGIANISPYPELLPLGTALASLFLVLLTWYLARATGSDRKVAFASGLVLLASLAWMGLPSLAGDELLGAALMTLTSICLYRGWKKDFAPLWLLCGFALVAVSTLTAGLPGLAFPLLTSLFFLIWRGTFRRGGARDGAIAFGVMLILLCAWGTLVAFSDGGRELLKTEIENQFLAPILYGWELQGRDAWIIFATLALLWVPWTQLVLFLPWERLGRFLRRIGSNRRECPGQGWLWCSLLVGLILYALLGAIAPLLLPPLLPPLAILTAQALLGMGERRSKIFFLILAILLTLCGVLYAVIAIFPLVLGPLPPVLAAIQPETLPITKAVIPVVGFLLFALLLWKGVDRRRADGSLLIFAILTLLLAAPLACFTRLSVDTLPQQTQESSSETSPVQLESTPDSQEQTSSGPTTPPETSIQETLPTPDEKQPETTLPAVQGLPPHIEDIPDVQKVPTEIPAPTEPDTVQQPDTVQVPSLS